ncbi:MAG: 2-amino-4-hydroxy-6-hydroxymethyldihydropteridine diphosphokinase [Prevotellaceae bacterium]|jgi:2-amino-4-hydroxy-6-hydroxymethyldihydropteridine diphosphokinase|nr:2-amino-4-hydroxy-6-hydroxymethyldihydropteridine diphosphokinase [Prevotellaceae bacterium]
MLYLGFGSNLGNREENIRNAIALISERVGEVVKVSSFYESEAWGYCSENRFLNAAAAIETTLPPEEILSIIKTIEKELGRSDKKSDTYEDRPIDIDILYYNDWVINTADLIIPHPHIAERAFVRVPLAEIKSPKNYP